MSRLTLTLACLPYDRLLPLLIGEIPVEGAEIVPIVSRWPLEIASRMLAHSEFDIAEMSITHAYVYTAKKRADFVVLPIFPSRMFRHGFAFVNTNAGIDNPKGLEGRRIGIQGHQATATVWIRGILREDFGVDFSGVHWFEGGVNQLGLKGGDTTVMRPNRPISIERIRDDQMLSEMLATGEVEALINPEIPNSLRASNSVARLFPDYHARERDYYRRTKIYPIMHVMVMRRSLYEMHPWLATSIYKACEQSKQLMLKQARYSGALAYMLPWMYEQIEEMDVLFGPDPWPYGLEANLPTLEAYTRILVDEGFLDMPVRLDDIFVPVDISAH